MGDQIQALLRHAIDLLERNCERLDLIEQRLGSIEAQLQQSSTQSDLINTEQAAKLIGCNRKTLNVYRDKYWKEGIHFFPQDKEIRYNRVLLSDWLINRSSAEAHQRAIEYWLAQQPSNQRHKSGRRKQK